MNSSAGLIESHEVSGSLIAVPNARSGRALRVDVREVPAEGGVLHVLVPRQGQEERAEDDWRPPLPSAVEQPAVRDERLLPDDCLLGLSRLFWPEPTLRVRQCLALCSPLICKIPGEVSISSGHRIIPRLLDVLQWQYFLELPIFRWTIFSVTTRGLQVTWWDMGPTTRGKSTTVALRLSP